MSLFLPVIPYFSFVQFEVGHFRLYTWGLMVGFGFAAGIIVSAFLANRAKFNVDHILNLAILIFFGSFFGARLFYVLFNPDEFKDNWVEAFRLYNGGMAFYGGFLMALIFGWLYLRFKKINFWQVADILAPGLALGTFFGRLGCLAIHDHIGSITSLPIGMEYFGEVRHEPMIYEAISSLVMFFFFLWWRKRTKYQGQLFLAFLVWYSAARLAFDFFRSYDLPFSDARYFGLTAAQHLSVLIIIAVIYIFRNKNRFLKQNVAEKIN